jgi:rod shape determining protein RodA
MIPTGMVLIQPDLGTALVYVFIFMAIGFVAAVPIRYLIGIIVSGLFCFPFFWHFLKDYQKAMLLVFLNPNIDPLGAGYTIIQSKIAIGSGRFLGKGWMAGTQSQLNFLAERHTDFIFSVWGEEWGFLGSVILVVLYGILIWMILRIAESAKDTFGRLLAIGVACVIFFHVFVNIAMNIGMCPVVGLPLPMMSYGGSSLVINLLGVGIVLNIARQR